MSWLGNLFTGNNNLPDPNNTVTGGTYAGVGQTTPSTLPYTTPTTHVGTTGYVHTTTGTTTIPTGGLAGAGIGVYNPNQTYTVSSGYNGYAPSIQITGKNPVIKTDQGTLNINELIELVETLRERLLILTPNFEKMEKYAALKKAYDHYKLMESMIGDEDEQK